MVYLTLVLRETNLKSADGVYLAIGLAGIASIALTAPLAAASVSLIDMPPAPTRHRRSFWIVSAPAIAFQAIYLSASFVPFIVLGAGSGNVAAALFWVIVYWCVLNIAGWVTARL